MRGGGELEVVLPAHDPHLTPGAAMELLAILMEASPEPFSGLLADAA